MKSEPRTSAIALTFHGVRSESGQMVAVGDSAAWRYVVSWKVFDAILERLLPSNCCCCEDFGQKDGDDWRILPFDDGLAADTGIRGATHPFLLASGNGRRALTEGIPALLRLGAGPPGETLAAVTLLEPFDPAPGVDQLLLAGEEGVAFVAQLDT